MKSPMRTGEGTPVLSDERLARELLGTLDRTDFGHLGVRHEGKCVTATSTGASAPS